MLNSRFDDAGQFARQQFGHNDPNTILVKNGSGGARERFDILAFNGTVFDPAEAESQYTNRPVLTGHVQTYPADIGNWCVLLKPLASNKIGPAVVGGWVPHKIQVKNASHKYAELASSGGDDQYRLISSNFGGARILNKQTGTGDKWAVIDIDRDFYGPLMVKLLEDMPAGTSKTATVQTSTDGNLSSGNQTITLKDSAAYIPDGRKLQTDDICEVVFVNGYWVLTQGPCSVPDE